MPRPLTSPIDTSLIPGQVSLCSWRLAVDPLESTRGISPSGRRRLDSDFGLLLAARAHNLDTARGLTAGGLRGQEALLQGLGLGSNRVHNSGSHSSRQGLHHALEQV